jgi:hypothetical protein
MSVISFPERQDGPPPAQTKTLPTEVYHYIPERAASAKPNCRVVYEVDDAARKIVILDVEHRRDIYR